MTSNTLFICHFKLHVVWKPHNYFLAMIRNVQDRMIYLFITSISFSNLSVYAFSRNKMWLYCLSRVDSTEFSIELNI
jgi:hypothetical protein